MKKTTTFSTQFSMTDVRESCEQSTRETSHSESLHTIPTLQEETNLSEGGIVEKLQNDSLVSIHIDVVRCWSEIVFGEKNVLDQSIQKVLENPSVSNKILWAISLNPQSIHRLAGKNICGFNNRARKNAMESLPRLHDAIYDLGKTSERVKSNITSQREQSGRREPMEGAEPLKSLLKSYHRAKKMGLLDNEMLEVLTKDSFIHKHQEKIQYLCIKVFRRPFILKEAIVSITQNPRAALILAHQLREMPEIYHSPAGFNICGFKNRARREAEMNMKELRRCILFYGDVVQSAKEFLQMEHLEQQKHTDMLQNQMPEAVVQNIHHARIEHSPTPQEERLQRVESERMALAM